MKKHILIMIVLPMLFLFPINGHAQTSQSKDPWAQLTKLASETTDAVQSGDTEAALTFVQAFSKEWQTLQKNSSLDITDVQSRTVNAAIDNLQKDLQTQADPIKLKRDSTELRLAEDAISSEGTPIWLSMGDQILASVKAVQKDVQAGNDQKFQVDMNKFLDLYQMVYPSMAIDVNANTLNKIESEVLLITNERMTYIQNRSQHTGNLQALSDDLKTAFQQPSQGVNALPSDSVNSMMFAIFGLIILILFYASWRKYKGTITPSN